ncbi:MAG TPA: ABC transporter permease subunit [Nitrospiria bacterium]|nr:ABC transporter permease subunit [Nitrospiria bacterium]
MARRRRWRMTRQAIIYAAGLVLLLGAVVLLYGEGESMSRIRLPHLRVPVDLRVLPFDALLSFGRMTAAYGLSLLFSLSVAYAAVSNRWAERIIIPAIDLLQSIPVLGFFPAVVFLFISATSGGHRVALEFSCIFLIFTSQAWNIAFGVYESWSTLPREAIEATQAYGLRGWLGFRRVYWPACLPRLIYNSIASWSAGWYFLIACEIITIGPLNYELPGLGNFLVHAAEEGRTDLLLAGLGALLTIVIAMELLLWRPLSVWSTKFRYELTVSTMQRQESFMIQWWSRSPITRRTRRLFRAVARRLVRIVRGWPWPRRVTRTVTAGIERSVRPVVIWQGGWWLAAVIVGLLIGLMIVKVAGALGALFRQPVPDEVWDIPTALGASFLRLLVAYLIALAWTLPVAIWASRRERVAQIIIPLAEIGASMPAMALFPLIVAVVVKYVGDMNAASILLLLTGMQWYLLFNLIVGATNLPGDLKEAGQAFRLPRTLYWRTVLLPAMVPSLITGSITAWGGGWNALIVSEYFVYHNQTYAVHGIGSLLNRAIYQTGNGPMIVYTLAALVAVVVLLTQLFWRRAYRLASDRYRFDY